MEESFNPIRPADFTSRELEVLALIASGLTNREIGQKLHLSYETVKWYAKQLYAKLGVRNRAQASRRAAESHLFSESTGRKEAAKAQKHNLPTPINRFIGRSKALVQVKDLVRQNRLVTLTGPGGVGKTRLALEAARELQRDFRDGLWLIEAVDLSDADQLPPAIAEATGFIRRDDVPLERGLHTYLAAKELCLLIDNLEHLPGAGTVLAALLARAPSISILATSRERLNLYGEVVYDVPLMVMPAAGSTEDPAAFVHYEAVSLFIDRSQRIQGAVDFSPSHLTAVVKICRLLDGLPLAIELAIPLIRIFSPEKIAELILGNLDRIPEGPQDVHARHRSLQASIDWSYRLLPPVEQKLYAMLSVFSPGASLGAVRTLLGNPPGNEHIRRISNLVTGNLVVPEEKADGEVYFKMLNTIREHAGMQLSAMGLAGEARRAHLEFCLQLVDRAEEGYASNRHPYWFRRVQIEQENLRVAFETAYEMGRAESCVRFIHGLRNYWRNFGFNNEGLEWCTRILGFQSNLPESLQAKLFCTAGDFFLDLRKAADAGPYLSDAQQIYRRIGDRSGEGWCLVLLGLFELEMTNNAAAAMDLIEEGLGLIKEQSDMARLAEGYNILGEVARYSGDFQRAEQCYRLCMEISEETGEKLRVAIQHSNLGMLAYQQGDFNSADRSGRQALRMFAELGAHYGAYYDIGALAGAALHLDQPHRAAKLLAISSAGMSALDATHQFADEEIVSGILEETQRRMTQEAFQSTWKEGARMPIWEAFDYAIEG